jgi:hypothetical protein
MKPQGKEVHVSVKAKYGIPLVLLLGVVLAALLFPARLQAFFASLKST